MHTLIQDSKGCILYFQNSNLFVIYSVIHYKGFYFSEFLVLKYLKNALLKDTSNAKQKNYVNDEKFWVTQRKMQWISLTVNEGRNRVEKKSISKSVENVEVV